MGRYGELYNGRRNHPLPLGQCSLFFSRRRRRRPSEFLEFFTAQINNDHTHKACLNATRRFTDWCDEKGTVGQLVSIQPRGCLATCRSCHPRQRVPASD